MHVGDQVRGDQSGELRVSAFFLAMELARHFHEGQKYGDKPYWHHLVQVSDICQDFIDAPEGSDLYTIAILHDILEDTECSPDTLVNIFGPNVAWCVAACSDEPGDNRGERKRSTNAKLSKIDAYGDFGLALIVKAADRLANVRACVKNSPEKLAMYREEHPEFRKAVYRPGFNGKIIRAIDALL